MSVLILALVLSAGSLGAAATALLVTFRVLARMDAYAAAAMHASGEPVSAAVLTSTLNSAAEERRQVYGNGKIPSFR